MKKNSTFWILLLYLLGLFMGALDTGIVTPARSVIQTQLGVNESIGIWMITIFTLAYAASIPITGKLADRLGSKVMYMVSIFLFGAGSLICSMASFTDSFTILLIGRVIQAFGGGGIMPIVTAEIGTSFPPEKRGMALGLVGGVYGIANILGSSAGSAILGIAGNAGWHWLFLINVPISIFIVLAGLFVLENRKSNIIKRMDLTGTIILTSMILSLMYSLTNIKFFDFLNSIQSTSVYPYWIIFAVLLPILIWVEKKAEDPILNLKYFMDRNMLITYLTGILVGVSMMGMVFVPQFAENALKIKTGAGGYFVTILGVFAGVGAPLSGKFVDKYGAKFVLMGGFIFNLIGGLFLAFVATQHMSLMNVLISLFFMGLGMGFTMGTPLNYMVLNSVSKAESNSALATLSLIRSIGTIISPAIMVGFLAAAGTNLQTDLTNQLPDPPKTLVIQQVEEIKPLLAQIKADPELMKRIDPSMLDIDKQMAGSTNTSTSSNKEIPQDLIDLFKSADVTTIDSVVLQFADRMFSDNVTPEVISKVQNGVQSGIDGMTTGINEVKKARTELIQNRTELQTKSDKLQKQIKDLDQAKAGIQKGIDGISAGITGMNKALDGMKQGISGLEKAVQGAQFAPPQVSEPLKAKLAATQKSAADMSAKIAASEAQVKSMKTKYIQLTSAQDGMKKAVKGMQEGISGMTEGIASIDQRLDLLTRTNAKLIEIKEAIPGAFAASKADYLKTLKDMSPKIESIFQTGLNKGFNQMYMLVALLSAMGILVLAFYKPPVAQSNALVESSEEV